MDEDEIEQWYEDEKQKAMDEYLGYLKSNRNRQEAEKSFNTKMDGLMKRYNQLMVEEINNKGKKNKFMDMFNKIIKLDFLNRK